MCLHLTTIGSSYKYLAIHQQSIGQSTHGGIAGNNRLAEASGHHYVAKCDVAFDNFDSDETTCTHAGNAQPLNNSCTDCCFVRLRTFDPATFP